MAYTTPPSLDSGISNATDALKAAVVSNYATIARAMVDKAFQRKGVNSPKVSIDVLMQLTEKILIPAVHKAEGGWSNHPKDSGGCTMRGVILSTLVNLFDSMFIDTGVPQVAAAARALNKAYPGWKRIKQNPTVAKQVLYVLLAEAKVGTLFVYHFMTAPDCREPVVVMSEDPWLGYLYLEAVWGAGGGVYGKANLDDVAKQFGWNGNSNSWVDFMLKLGDKSLELGLKMLLARIQWAINISGPNADNSEFREGWLNRLLRNNDSDLMMLVKINELFNLNTKGYFKFTEQEQDHLMRKGEVHKTMKIIIP